MKTLETMEYEDAPSGQVKLYNYKEPFMKYEGGHGYQGVLLFDVDTDNVQCHLCGEWFESLGNHLHKEHSTTAADYKKEVGLLNSTALIGEKYRAKLIANGLEARKANMRPGRKKTQAEKDKIRAAWALKRTEGRLETANKRGTCPLQLLERIRKEYDVRGRTPTTREMKNSYPTIVKVWGSWKKACEMAGIPYRDGHAPVDPRIKYHEVDVISFIRRFFDGHGFLPTNRDNVALYTSSAVKKMGGWRRAREIALKSDGRYRDPRQPKPINRGVRSLRAFRYSKDDLLMFLNQFEKIHGRPPAVSDCKRRLLPHASRYIYYWGSWKGALKAAGL